MSARILVVAAEMGWLGKGMLGMAMLARPEMDMVNDSVYVGESDPACVWKVEAVAAELSLCDNWQ